MSKRRTIAERIEFKLQVDMLTGCHRYTGEHDRDGYGLITITVVDESTGKKKSVRRRVHRVRYEIEVGPIPPKYVVDHVVARGCSFRDCCNPDDLEAVTVTINSQRVRNWNSAKTHCPRGHRYDALVDDDTDEVLSFGSAIFRTGKDGVTRRYCGACGK